MEILKFYSKTCGPCKAQNKILEELDGVEIVPVEYSVDTSLFDEYQIGTVPTLILRDNGEIIHKFVGLTTLEEINSVINNLPNGRS